MRATSLAVILAGLCLVSGSPLWSAVAAPGPMATMISGAGAAQEAPARSDGRSPVPNAADQKAALAAIRKLYKDDYAGAAGKRQKKALGEKLLAQATATTDDARVRYVLFSEAVGCAVQAEDISGIIAILDEASRHYGDGFDALAEKKTALARVRRVEAAAALKLFDHPDDPAANLLVGRYYCFDANRWDIGLPLLAAGSDADWKRAAELELAKPTGAPQQMELGDRWDELGVAARSPLKEDLWSRAHSWYKQALPALSGLSKERIAQRLDDLFGLVPDPTIDYGNLSDRQWERLKGTVFEVSATRIKSDTHLALKPGQKARIVAHPSDTWIFNDYYGNGEKQVTAKGIPDLRFKALGAGSNLPALALMCWVAESAKQLPGVLEGPGSICLGPNDPYNLAHHGVIRAKVMLLDEQ